MELKIGNRVVAEFTNKQVELIAGRRMKLAGKFKAARMKGFNDFLYYCTINDVQQYLDKLEDLVIKDLTLELT